MSYLDELNPNQRAAVENIYGPTMVIAGAGSGKTRVLTYRIAYMMEQQIDPFNILALTFTNKAAREMQDRIIKVGNSGAMGYYGPSEVKQLTMGTFHSVFARMLRFNAERIAYPINYTIYDTQDAKSVLKDVIKNLNLDAKTYKPSSVLGRISTAKNNLISPDEYLQNEDIMAEDRMSRRPEIGRIYKAYSERCFRAGAMDFDDLLFNTYRLLKNFPDVLSYYQQKFQYILVDEYQDTNHAQYVIVKMLAAVYENICVVGDDAQSIYSFRGANIENIFKFRKDYPDFKLFKLEQNYRSIKNIVEAANSVIARNVEQIKKNVWTENEEGSLIHVVRTLTDSEEGKQIVGRLYDLKNREGCSYNDFAILYRTNRQSRSFEEALRKLNVPYKIYGGLSFYQRKEIKDILAYFRLTTNHYDEEAFKRVINYPKRGIGKTTIEHLIIASNKHNLPIWDIISNFDSYEIEVNATAKKKITEFKTMIDSFTAQLNQMNAFEIGHYIAKSSGIIKELHDEKEKGMEEVERFQNLEELLSGLKDFSKSKEEADEDASLSEFMIDVALLTDADEDKGDERNHVTLMTIHSSKGLEFPHVFLVGLEENLFPSQMALQSRSETEEERRLFYVAITRAMKTCTLSYANSRFQFGSISSSEPSRFLDEIDSKYLHFETPQRGQARSLNTGRPVGMGFPKTGGLNKSLAGSTSQFAGKNLKPIKQVVGSNSVDSQDIKVGYNVEHDRFGKGKVTKIEGSGADKKATVFFPHHGSKVVLLRFAKMTVLDN